MTDRERFSPLTTAADGLLLVCALGGFTASFLSLYGNAEHGMYAPYSATPLDLCAAQGENILTVAGIFALLSLCAWSLPRLRAAAVGGLAALLALVATLNLTQMVLGAELTLHTVTVLFSQRVPWGWVFPCDSNLSWRQEGAAARLFLILALALLALALGWAVVRARRWWIVALLTLPPLLPGLLANLYPDWLPFMALSACWCAMLLTDLCKWAAPSRRGVLSLTALAGAAAVLAIITLAFPREGYTRPQWALDLEAELNSGVSRLSDFFSQFDGPFGQHSVTYVGSAAEANLADAGPLRYTGRTVLRVRSDYDGRLYLRGSSLAVYEDGVWRALPEGTYQAYLDSLGDQESSLSPLVFPTGLNGQTATSTVTVDNVGAVGACVYTPYFLTVQDWAALGMLPVEDAYFARLQGQWSHTMGFCPAGAVPLYSVDSAEVSAYRDYARTNYLDVPPGLAELLLELCRQNGIYETDYYRGQSQPETALLAARQVADMLNSLCEYDPEAPAAPAGADPVLYFLNESRRGYCMHYASAATLMLRSLGIPARYVSGFTVESVPNRQVTVPDRAAHAWVEVWVDGFGWYPVEVTPAAAFDWYQQGVVTPEDLPSDPVEESEEPTPTPTPVPTPSQAPDEEVSEPPSQEPQGAGGEEPEQGPDLTVLIAAAKVLAPVAGVLLLLWLGQWLLKQHRAKKLASPDHNRAALNAYGYLLRMERWGGRMAPRAVELAQKARFSQHTLTPEELDELRAMTDRERERLCVVLGPLSRLAFRYLWGMPKKRPPKKPE